MLLITQTLLASWGYVFNCYEGGEDAAMADFVSTLRREKKPPTEAMQAGLDFEALVYSIAEGTFKPDFVTDGSINPASYADGDIMGYDKYPKNYAGAVQVADIIQGGQFQVKCSRPITVDGHDFLVYGILDAVKSGIIYDVKYKTKSFGSIDLAGYYLESPQHPAYFYMVPGAREFRYLVSDGTDLYIETYPRNEARYIGDIIGEFYDSIESMGLIGLYQQYWQAME